jgi:uncharacterized protein (DUF1330 family)
MLRMAVLKVNWKKYLNSSNPTINKYLSDFGDSFIIQTFQRIKLAYQTRKSQIILIRFKHSDVVATIESKDYVLALEHLLQLCVNLEKYELCRDIHTAINLIKSKRRMRVKSPPLVISS